jgi:hypothetical protein
MNAYGSIHMGVLLRKRHSHSGALHIAAGIYHQTNTFCCQGREDFMAVGIESPGIIMSMGIKNGHTLIPHGSDFYSCLL